jgi:dCTP deaminase
MGIKPDKWIKKMAIDHEMIKPFSEGQVREGSISYGTSAYGYDIRVADEYKVFTDKSIPLLDPKSFNTDAFVDVKEDHCIIPPNSFILARSLEYFKIPRDILAVCDGKSTYCRCGVVVNVSPLEPCWEGYLTMAISNTAPVPVKIYSGEGIAQILFLEAAEICEVSYKDKKGKYQAQKEITVSKI